MQPDDQQDAAQDFGPASGGPAWTPARAESRLRSLELFGSASASTGCGA